MYGCVAANGDARMNAAADEFRPSATPQQSVRVCHPPLPVHLTLHGRSESPGAATAGLRLVLRASRVGGSRGVLCPGICGIYSKLREMSLYDVM